MKVEIQTSSARGRQKTHCPQGHALIDGNVYAYDGQRRCRTCSLERAEAWRKANPERYRELQRRSQRSQSRLRRKYGLSIAALDALVAAQAGCCAVCDIVLTFEARGAKHRASAVVDHCHSTGVVRGILCLRCNAGLGQFEDRADLVARAAAYLTKERP